jgi:Lsr2
MAQKVQIILEDDIDGGEAEETIEFSLDGQRYEIDLSTKNAAALRDAFGPYVGAARKAERRGGGGGGGRGRGRGRGRGSDGDGGGRAGSTGEDTAAIRAWAREQGLKVNERGRIPGTIVEQYRAAH